MTITLLGHPFASIGMGEQMRSHIAACDAVRLPIRVADLFGHASRSDPAHLALVAGREAITLADGIRVFHLNADEVEDAIAAIAARGGRFEGGRNIIVPAWELPRYPKSWARALARFDEVWAISRFVRDALRTAGIDSHLIGQAVQPASGVRLPRRHFGLRESAFVLLTTLDLSSYASRKNPAAALELVRRLKAAHPTLDLQLALKAKQGERDAREWAAGLVGDTAPELVRVIATPLDNLGMTSLIAVADCLVSLHRSEGFGRGLGEAMALGRLALGTGWSGNLDFMTQEGSLLVDHELVPVPAGAYPHARGQVWAEPDVEHAARLLLPILADPARGRDRALRGQADVMRTHSNRAVGLRILERLETSKEASSSFLKKRTKKLLKE